MAEMIATLSDACEREFGFLATRLFRVFKTEESQGTFFFIMTHSLAIGFFRCIKKTYPTITNMLVF